MPRPRNPSLLRSSLALALGLGLAACTKGGQFDPTELLNSDMLDAKKKIAGDREPVFPQGVPGTTTGVPAELVKGYQPPPEQTEAPAVPAPAAEAKPKPKPKSKPQVAAAPPQQQRPRQQQQDSVWNQTPAVSAAAPPQQQQQQQDPVWNQTPAAPAAAQPARISIGRASQPATATPQGAAAQTPWPAPQQPGQSSQTVWPDSSAPPAKSQ